MAFMIAIKTKWPLLDDNQELLGFSSVDKLHTKSTKMG